MFTYIRLLFGNDFEFSWLFVNNRFYLVLQLQHLEMDNRVCFTTVDVHCDFIIISVDDSSNKQSDRLIVRST